MSLSSVMSIPNYVPQSPTWLVRITSKPMNSRTRLMLSPWMVDLKWPTCISLAILGLEKSTTTLVYVFVSSSTATDTGPFLRSLIISSWMKSFLRVMFRKNPLFAGSPFPACLSSTFSMTVFSSRFYATAYAISWQVGNPNDPCFLDMLKILIVEGLV